MNWNPPVGSGARSVWRTDTDGCSPQLETRATKRWSTINLLSRHRGEYNILISGEVAASSEEGKIAKLLELHCYIYYILYIIYNIIYIIYYVYYIYYISDPKMIVSVTFCCLVHSYNLDWSMLFRRLAFFSLWRWNQRLHSLVISPWVEDHWPVKSNVIMLDGMQ